MTAAALIEPREFRLAGENAHRGAAFALATFGVVLMLSAAWLLFSDPPADFPPTATEPANVQAAAPASATQPVPGLPACPELGPIPFDSASAIPSPADTQTAIARLLPWLDRHAQARVTLEGHSDALGPDQVNLVLSYQRAIAVEALLMKAGIPKHRIMIAAIGKHEPVEGLPADAGANRRVTLRVVNASGCLSVFP